MLLLRRTWHFPSAPTKVQTKELKNKEKEREHKRTYTLTYTYTWTHSHTLCLCFFLNLSQARFLRYCNHHTTELRRQWCWRPWWWRWTRRRTASFSGRKIFASVRHGGSSTPEFLAFWSSSQVSCRASLWVSCHWASSTSKSSNVVALLPRKNRLVCPYLQSPLWPKKTTFPLSFI